MTTRADVISKAREYLDTPFHHQARVKGRGVDCLGLLICVGRDLGFLRADFDRQDYGHVPNSKIMRAGLAEQLDEIPVADLQPGDVMFLTFDGEPTHVAFKTDRGMLHAFSSARRVVEHSMDDLWLSRIRGAYRIRGLED